MRITLDPCFILHTRPYTDSSLIAEVFSLHHGLMHALARSARGVKSRFRGNIQPFSPLLISFSGKTDLKQIQHIEQNGLSYSLPGQALICGFYLNELLVRLLPLHDAHSVLFNRYDVTLQHLQQNHHLACYLRFFELDLLEELGYGIVLGTDAASFQPIVADCYYQFVHEKGLVMVDQSNQQQVTSCYSGKTLLALRRRQFIEDPQQLREAKHLLRNALQFLLGDKTIKSRELL